MPATTPDVTQTATIHRALADHHVLPDEQDVDGGSTSAAHLETSAAQDIARISPVGQDTRWQARSEDGIRV